LTITRQLDEACGPVLNEGKSFWSHVGARRKPRVPAGSLLSQLPYSAAPIKYLGLDLVVAGARSRKCKFGHRVVHCLKRLQLAKCLPQSSRFRVVGDAMSSLWLRSGPVVTVAQGRSLVSAAASAVRGRKPEGTVKFRSRPAELLLYSPGVHRSHVWAALCYEVLSHFASVAVRLRPDWHLLWPQRANVRGGPMASLMLAFSALRISWIAPESIACGHLSWDFVSAESRGQHLHSLRDLLRLAVWREEARRRPKDFAGAEGGIARDPFFSQAPNVPCGPSLCTMGQWTRVRMFRAGVATAPGCVRCRGGVPETLSHRLWQCPANATARASLDRGLVALGEGGLAASLPAGLPACLARGALVPCDTVLSADACKLIQAYLLQVTREATSALALRCRGDG
jgi:hypothetical protein